MSLNTSSLITSVSALAACQCYSRRHGNFYSCLYNRR